MDVGVLYTQDHCQAILVLSQFITGHQTLCV